ncbi:probable galacturonosyltransferase 7 isoform X2 [Diospyros lotus]|uniref:probable galacturonosyltransferase 7 isoform X2 n=1 Tax=Diospyros lotus TaxID=55363 RepID=UPI00225A3D16|nr:probable galacturonosyltransferase 7 isoform X2 [Diospyros lotus]
MKGGGSSSSSYGSLPPAKRRWRGLVVGVLGLVLLSMLVPLVFLLGLHNGFHSTPAYPTEQRTSDSIDLKVYDRHSRGKSGNQSKGDQSTAHVDDLIRRLEPTLPKDFKKEPVKAAVNNTIGSTVSSDAPKPRHRENRTRTGRIVEVAEHMTTRAGGKVEVAEHMTTRTSGMVEVAEHMKSVTDEIEKSCEVKFGSYCLWRQEHREKMKDDTVKKMKDQLFVARAYYPSIAKLPAHEKLSREMKQNIQEFERLLSETTTDADLPRQIEDKLQKMETVIAQAKSFVVDCNNVDKKLRQLVDLTEDEANFHMKQSAFLYQLSAQTMPKSLHCLSMRLTLEYFRSPPPDMEPSVADKYNNPALHHYVIFSNNVLASSAVINSTVMHSKESGNQVFHVLTDQQNYFAMKLWFYENTYKDATIHVLNVEDFNLSDMEATALHMSSAEEFRISFPSTDTLSTTHIRTEYISIFSHLHYLLPKIFGNFKKVVVLDDDVVVQRDLSALWSLDIEGKVIGATQFCAVRLGQLRNFLGDNISNTNSCAWMSGLNVVDLVRWRELDVTETFWKLVQKPNAGEELFQAAALRASLFAFQGLVHALDDTWVLSGLGHDYSLDTESIQKAAVLHYNGNMKPWIEMGIPKYKGYWRTFVNRENHFLSDCNVNP